MGVLQRIRGVCLGLIVILVTQVAAGSPVEELAKRLPDNTIGFVATSGGDALKGDFDKSILGRLWNDPNTRAFCTPLWTQLRTALAREAPDANAPKYMDMAMEYASLFAGRPIIVGVAQAEVKKGPPICVFAIVDAGDRKGQLTEAITKLETQFGKDEIVEMERASLKMHGLKDNNDLSLYWGWAGNYLVVAGNDAQDTAIKYVSKPRATAPEYFKKVPSTDDALVVHYDFRKTVQIVRLFVAEEGGDVDPNVITKVLTGLGLDKVGGLTAREGFSGADIISEEFMEAPEPRMGLLAAFKPVDLASFGFVDANALEASAINCDVTGLNDMVLSTIKAASSDEDYRDIEKGLADFESQVKVSIRKDLLGSLAGPVVFYSLPAGKMIEAPMGGFVVVAKLKDPALFEKTMVSLGTYASSRSEGMLQISDQNNAGGTTHVWSVPTLALMQMMPTWSVIGDNLVVGSNAALHQKECKYVTPGTRRPASLLDSDGYKKVTARLPKNLLGFTYVDSQVQFSQTMTSLQQAWPMAVMMAAKEGVMLPVMLPNLDRVIKQMQPGCQYAYFDADGLRWHCQGSGIESSPSMAVAGGAVAMAISMPALARVRQQAVKVTSATNLKEIGMACLLYSNDHGDKMPPDLETLVKEVELSPKSLESKTKPKDFEGPSYVYIAGQATSMSPENIVAYENPEFCTEGVNVLYLDCHVAFVKPQQFREQLAQTYKRLGREMPPIRFKGEVKPVLPKGPNAKDQTTLGQVADAARS
jgi:prepilin-type processing-associated H-X9-DG protein